MHNHHDTEKLLSLKAAAKAIGVPVWKLRRAVKQNLLPSYTILNSRRYVLVSEVVAAMKTGGSDE